MRGAKRTELIKLFGLNPQELRIGNFVDVDKSEIAQIQKINSDEFQEFRNEEKGIHVITFPFASGESEMFESNIRPIPITEEWLIKFGFKLINIATNPYEFQYQLDYWIIRKSTEFGIEVCQDLGEHYVNRLRSIDFVHDIQNLYFSITGKELKYYNKIKKS